MTDVVVTPQNIDQDGLVVVHTGSLLITNNYIIRNDGRMFIRVVNGGGSPAVTTIVTRNKVAGNAIADRVVSVEAGTEQNIGPFPPSVFNNSDGDIDVSFDFITSVTLAALHLGNP